MASFDNFFTVKLSLTHSSSLPLKLITYVGCWNFFWGTFHQKFIVLIQQIFLIHYFIPISIFILTLIFTLPLTLYKLLIHFNLFYQYLNIFQLFYILVHLIYVLLSPRIIDESGGNRLCSHQTIPFTSVFNSIDINALQIPAASMLHLHTEPTLLFCWTGQRCGGRAAGVRPGGRACGHARAHAHCAGAGTSMAVGLG